VVYYFSECYCSKYPTNDTYSASTAKSTVDRKVYFKRRVRGKWFDKPLTANWSLEIHLTVYSRLRGACTVGVICGVFTAITFTEIINHLPRTSTAKSTVDRKVYFKRRVRGKWFIISVNVIAVNTPQMTPTVQAPRSRTRRLKYTLRSTVDLAVLAL
jgi:hypothetical protein